MSVAGIKKISFSEPAIEGAGVHLHRAFGFGKTEDFDPFLLFDDFRGEKREDYIAGFPWHPHRGIETITYVLSGSVEHRDSLGNQGVMTDGDLQWMTAGSGIIHQEMPEGDKSGKMHGFQLWANLPSSLKMTNPRYQDIHSSEIPEVTEDDGTKARILCGTGFGKTGPVDGIAADPVYLDISVPPGISRRLKLETGKHSFAYVFAGSGYFHQASAPRGVLTENLLTDEVYRAQAVQNRHIILFDQGDEIFLTAGDQGFRFLLALGKPLNEPIAWYGPIVMNTQAEIRKAMEDLQQGTFLQS